MNKKFFAFLFFCLLSLFANNVYAWREVNPCIGNLAAQCSYYVTNVKIGTLPLDTTKTVTAQDSDKIWGEIDSNQKISISWALVSKPNKIPTKAPTGYFYIINQKCSNSLSDLTSDLYGYQLINQISANQSFTQNISYQIPEKSENIAGCSDATKTCYCRIAWQLFDKNKALKAGSLTQPFVIKNSSISNVKIYYPTPTQKAGSDYEESAVILKLKKDQLDLTKATSQQVNDFLTKRNLKLGKRINSFNLLYAKNPNKAIYSNIVSTMKNDEQLEFVQPNNYYKFVFTPNDTEYKSQYSLNNDGSPTGITGAKKDADMDVVEAWDKYNPTKDIIVAVIDSGFKTDSSDINYWDGSSCWAPDGSGKCPNHGWDTFNNDNDPSKGHFHGVFTSSIIGSKTNNNLGMAGMSSKDRVKVMLIKTSNDDPTPFLDSSSIVSGIEFAIKNKANIINGSFGGRGYDPSEEIAFKSFVDAGGLAIVAAGNFGTEHNSSNVVTPCDIKLDALLCIASSDQADKRSTFSDYGQTVHIAAPGSLIKGMNHDGQYSFENGTSCSSPNAAGVAAMVWSQKTNLTNKELAKLIMDTGDPLSDFAGKTVTGKRVNAYRALTGEDPPNEESENDEDDGSEDDDNNDDQPADFKIIYPNGGEEFKTGDEVEIKWNTGKDTDAKIMLTLIDYQSGAPKHIVVSFDENNDGSYKFKIIDSMLETISGSSKKGDKYKIGGVLYNFKTINKTLFKIYSNVLATYLDKGLKIGVASDVSDDYFSINMEDGDEEETPPEDGDEEETPPEDGDEEETPPEDGDEEETPPEDGDEEETPPEEEHSIDKPLVVSESMDIYNNKLRFRATVYVGQKPADVEYWFESYQRDDSGSPISGTQERTPNPNGQMRTGPGMNHLFTGYRNSYISGKIYCFTPYAKFKGADDADAGFGAEYCYPDIPWVITLPATNWQESKATINGAITYFAKNPKLTAYFKYYVKGDEKNAEETTGKSYSKPTSGSERTPFSEPFTIPDVMKEYCYRACAKVPSNSKIFGCGAEWCFPVQSTSTDDLIVKNEKAQTEDGSATTFYGYIENFNKTTWGIPTSKIVPGFKVYPKGSWGEDSDKNINIKWLGPQNQSSFTVNNSKKVANFSIYSEGMDFKSSSYCFRAYVIDKVNKKTIYAKNEICGDGSENGNDDNNEEDNQEEDDGSEDDDNNEEDNKTGCSIVQLSTSWCYPCQQLKPILSSVAKKYNTILDESIDNQSKYDSNVIGNKTGKTKFFYVDISQIYPKDLKSLQSKYDLQEGVPRILVYKDGKDVILTRVSFFSEGGFNEDQIIDSTIKKYCGDPYK